jgi:ribose transport system ATP-binding protein
MKIISGVYTLDAGTIQYEGKSVAFKNPREAQEAGITIIHQELNLIKELSIAENIFLGREPKGVMGRINWKKLYADSKALIDRLGLKRSPEVLVNELSIAEQQLVEIAKAISFNAKVIIMDEPTDALTESETACLFKLMRELKAEQKAIVFISHRLEEIFEVCDQLTILRDGKPVCEAEVSDFTQEKIIEAMVGRKLEDQYPYLPAKSDSKTILSVKSLENKRVHDMSFEVKAGEVFGISGLVGSGRTELAKTLYGLQGFEKGEIILDGEKVCFKSPADALKKGLAYISEDRKSEGLVLGLSVAENMTLSSLQQFVGKLGNISHSKEKDVVANYIKKMAVKTPSQGQTIKLLSGGNQQKVAIAKGILNQPKVLILDEPTRGVDVGAKKEIYEIINQLKAEGMGVIVISSEMPELLGISDRIMVVHEGRNKGILGRSEASQEKIMRCALQ